MVRKRKVWGVLGLLLALGLAVGSGYGQKAIPLKQTAILTVNNNCTRAANGKLELFVIDNDVHPTRNITYQNDPASVSFPRPDNPPNCPGVAYFFSGWPPVYYGGAIQLYIVDFQSFIFKFKLCFRKFPPPPTIPPNQNPILYITATSSPGISLPLWSASPTIDVTPNCLCIPGPVADVKEGGTQWIKWTFKIQRNSVEFCRLEAEYTPY